jgi:myo-inositol catabolism protein IolS
MKNRIGLGTFPLASVFTKISPIESEKVIESFLNSGGYYIDTAPLYGFGKVEETLGKVLKKYPRNNFSIGTKCGFIDVEGKTFQTVGKSCKYNNVIRECERSLKRLNLDYIDTYYVHSPDPNTSFEETMKALNKLKQDGKIKDIAVSNVNLFELKEYCKYGNIKYIQNRFSLINQSINNELKEYLLENKISLVPYQIIDRGQLSDRSFEQIKNFRSDDLRVGRSDWQEEQIKTIYNWVQKSLVPIAKKLQITTSHLVIAWAIYQPFIKFVILGATNPQSVIANLKADDIKLDNKSIEEVDKSYSLLEDHIKQKYQQTLKEYRGLNDKYY